MPPPITYPGHMSGTVNPWRGTTSKGVEAANEVWLGRQWDVPTTLIAWAATDVWRGRDGQPALESPPWVEGPVCAPVGWLLPMDLVPRIKARLDTQLAEYRQRHADEQAKTTLRRQRTRASVT